MAAGTGTFGYEPNVDTFFGFPRAIKPGGVVFDIPITQITASNDGDVQKRIQYTQQTGILSSALEHAVPEQLFVNEQNPGEAISAVKALQKANAQGQRIYHITQANQSAILGNIHHDSDTMTEISNALNAGKEVITHTDAVSVPGWSGAGYIISDPETGAGAYKIAGGGNGGWLTLDMFIGIFAGIFLGLGIVSLNVLIAGASLLYFIPFLITLAFIIGLYSLIDSTKDFAVGALLGLTGSALLVEFSLKGLIEFILKIIIISVS